MSVTDINMAPDSHINGYTAVILPRGTYWEFDSYGLNSPGYKLKQGLHDYCSVYPDDVICGSSEHSPVHD